MHFIKHGGFQYQLFSLLRRRAAFFTREQHFQSSDLKMLQNRGYTEKCLCKQGNIVICCIEVGFTFGLPDYVHHIEEFVISRFYSIHFTVTLAGT